MAIQESPFDSEDELERWVFSHLSEFLGECVLLRKFQISTSAGKRCIPDGIAFNFATNEWYVLEAELLRHGVWPHIAEQITRFVVALQNPGSLRIIRDKLFEHLIDSDSSNRVASTFGIGIDRLLQKIEIFVEGIQPSIVIFIDDANQDLNDFAHAMDVSTQIYRVKKFLVDGRPEYYSPDQQVPVIATTPDEKAASGSQDLDIVELLGGGILVAGKGRFKCYKLDDGRIIHIKRSKFHAQDKYYWYGLNANTLDQVDALGVTHFVFIMGEWGYTVVPKQIVIDFCSTTKASKNTDGTVRHYHLLISPEPNPELYWSNESPKFDLSDGAVSFD